MLVGDMACLPRTGMPSDPRRQMILAITFNNLGTHYRRVGRLRASLGCFQEEASPSLVSLCMPLCTTVICHHIRQD